MRNSSMYVELICGPHGGQRLGSESNAICLRNPTQGVTRLVLRTTAVTDNPFLVQFLFWETC